MFSGIIEEIGTVMERLPLDAGHRFVIAASAVLEGLRVGDSIAVDGVCQTIVSLGADSLAVESIATTLSRTTLGSLDQGVEVNLERALAFGARVGGHLVQGHVDGVGRVMAIDRRGEHVLLDVSLPAGVADVAVLHGSIALNGVSLTINALKPGDVVQVALIPHTWNHTTLRRLSPGDGVNVEGDMLGRFVAHLVKRQGGTGV
jgi:riboflavin synthase